MTCGESQIEGQFAIVALQGQIRAAIKQGSDHFAITVLRRSVERGVAALFADIRIRFILEQ